MLFDMGVGRVIRGAEAAVPVQSKRSPYAAQRNTGKISAKTITYCFKTAINPVLSQRATFRYKNDFFLNP